MLESTLTEGTSLAKKYRKALFRIYKNSIYTITYTMCVTVTFGF